MPREFAGDLKGGLPTILFPPSEMRRIVDDFTWLPDGRLIYPVREPGAIGDTCNYWAMRLDTRTGQTIEKPRQLTNWAGYCMGSTYATSDGKRIVFVRWEQHITSYVADLVAEGTRILEPKRFPMSESSDAVADWAPDSKSTILVSNRSGRYGIYKQSLDKDTAEPIVTQGFHRDAHMSPDGKSVIYFGIGENGPWPIKGPEPVMRASIAGGPSPQRLFTASPGSLLSCARSPSELCAIGEPTEDGKQLTVSAFDPLKGRGVELFRITLGPNDGNWRLNVSPDGTRFAALPSSVGPINIYSLEGEILQTVRLKGWSHLQSSIWAADGKSLFVTANIRGGTVVLHVNLQGNAHVMWKNAGISLETLAHPSPDGRHLEFDGWTMNGNMWMLENF
jgi:Tol biopolymer transport system component